MKRFWVVFFIDFIMVLCFVGRHDDVFAGFDSLDIIVEFTLEIWYGRFELDVAYHTYEVFLKVA